MFAEQAATFRRALESVDFGDAIVVTDDPAALSRPAVALVAGARDAGDAGGRGLDRGDPARRAAAYMLTSGSTSLPKAVIQTQRMLASNLAQGRQVLGQTAGWSDVMLDWLPWNHVSGAYTLMGTLTSGGTLYIDGGRPMPGQFDESLRNLKEVAPKFYVNVPFGYAMLADALEKDAELRQRFFGSVRLALYGGAGLPQALYDRFQQLAVETVGERIFFTTGYGATETSSGCMAIYFPTEEVGIGLPMPGLTLKLVPNGAALRGAVARPDDHAGLPGQPRGEPRHLRRRGLLPHRRRRAVPRPAGHRQGLAVRRPAGRGVQARHRHLGAGRADCAPSSSRPSRHWSRTCWSAARTATYVAMLAWPTAGADAALLPAELRACASRRSTATAARASASSGCCCSPSRRASTSTRCPTRARSTSASRWRAASPTSNGSTPPHPVAA